MVIISGFFDYHIVFLSSAFVWIIILNTYNTEKMENIGTTRVPAVVKLGTIQDYSMIIYYKALLTKCVF